MTSKQDPTIGKDGKSYPLTPQQVKFVEAYLETGNGCEALRRAYPRAVKWQSQAQRVRASELLDNPRIAATIEQHRANAARNTQVTVESIIAELDEIKARAMESEKGVSAAVSAVLGKAKLLGFMVDKVDQTVRQATPEEHKPDLSSLRQKAALVDGSAAQHLGTAGAPVTESKLTH